MTNGSSDHAGPDGANSWSERMTANVKRPLSMIPISAVIGTTPVVRAAQAPSEASAELFAFEHPSWALEMLNEVNALRRDNGLVAVELCAALGFAAAQYSETMASHQWLLHKGPDGSLPIDRVRAAGYNGETVSENIATGFNSASATLRAFMVSGSHRATILGVDHRFAGFGSDQGYWTQYFGSGPSC